MLSGYRIKEARKKKGMSQQFLGDALGVSKVSICGYEMGTRTPTIDTFLKLIELLDLTPEYALGMEVSAVNEEGNTYGTKFSKEDVEVINELKKHPELYNRLCENPKRNVEKISNTLKK